VSQAVVSLSAQQAQVLRLVLPCLSGTVADRAEVSGDLVRIWVRAVAGGAACPGCGAWCTAVHDRYLRRLRDAAAGGRRVLIWLVVRLLRCGNAECPRASFAEQPEGLAVPYARRTPLLAGQLGAVAAALAGRAGSRLARAVLAAEVSRHTLIRVLMALPGPAAGPVRVLGIDDFSLRRGRDYATLLVDMETGEPADVLPDREAGTVRDWLEEHPEVEVICRDRAGAYAQAAADGAPGAVQVADRWHLWHNLCEHVRDAVGRHQGCLDGPGCGGPQELPGPPRHDHPGHAAGAGGMPAGAEAVIRERHAAVRRLRAAGKTLPEAAAALGLSRQSTGRLWRAASADALLKVRGVSALDPWKPYLLRRWDQGPAKIAVLHRGDHRARLCRQRAHHLRLAGPAQARRPASPASPARETAGHRVDTHRPCPPGRRSAGAAHRHPRPLPRTGRPDRARHRIRHDPHPPRRRPPRRLARRRRGQPRPARARLVRQRHPPRLPGRPQRPDPGMELRPRRGPQHPHQADQTPDIRTRILLPPPQAHPPDQLKQQPSDHPEIYDRAPAD
jgi:hypothetical protein